MSTPPRGLGTLALLKTRFDDGKDHIGMLEPFVADAVAHFDRDSFVAVDIVKAVEDRHSLRLPSDTVKTVLGRLVKRKELRREGGRFMASEIQDRGLEAARQEIAIQQEYLGTQLVSFLADNHRYFSDDDALAVLAQFITDNKVPLLLDEALPDSPLERSTLDRKTARLVARFIAEKCLPSEDLTQALQGLIEGMVLEDALLLRDIANLPQRFRNLIIVLDTPILFAALDLTGLANGLATREFLTLVRDAGAVTIAFDRTVNELKRILAVYEARLATAQGRLGLYPTDLTHHFLTSRTSPSQVRTISATLERRLAKLGVQLRDLPDRDRRYTLDESALARALKDDSGETDSPRIRHDIDCVASTLTLRRGRTATSLEQSRAVFCTTSSRVIRNTQAWYRDEGEHGAPPIVHQYALSSIAWLKRPKATRGVKLHELAALCSAALRPTRQTWDKFIANIHELRADGVISDDEAVAVVANEFTEPLLAQLDEESEPDADTIQEAIDRVIERYRDDAQAASATAIYEARGETALARAVADDAMARLELLRRVAQRRADLIGRAAADVTFIAFAAIVILAAVLSLPGLSDAVSGAAQLVARIVVGLGIIVGLYTQIIGPSLLDIRRTLRARVTAATVPFFYNANVNGTTPSEQTFEIAGGNPQSGEKASGR